MQRTSIGIAINHVIGMLVISFKCNYESTGSRYGWISGEILGSGSGWSPGSSRDLAGSDILGFAKDMHPTGSKNSGSGAAVNVTRSTIHLFYSVEGLVECHWFTHHLSVSWCHCRNAGQQRATEVLRRPH